MFFSNQLQCRVHSEVGAGFNQGLVLLVLLGKPATSDKLCSHPRPLSLGPPSSTSLPMTRQSIINMPARGSFKENSSKRVMSHLHHLCWCPVALLDKHQSPSCMTLTGTFRTAPTQVQAVSPVTSPQPPPRPLLNQTRTLLLHTHCPLCPPRPSLFLCFYPQPPAYVVTPPAAVIPQNARGESVQAAVCALLVLGPSFYSCFFDGAMEGLVCLSAPLDQELLGVEDITLFILSPHPA